MDFHDPDGMNGSCPPVEMLRAFSLGDLVSSPFDAVAQHIQTCVACETLLDQLPEASDSLVDRLRRIGAETIDEAPPAPVPFSLPRTLGPYELLEAIGEGGMGIVYRARQENPNRLVAVKMLLGGALAGPVALARMRTEIRAAGRLNHPAIVPVYDQGEQHGRPYFVMEYLPGGTLERRLRQGGPLPEREAADLVRNLAQATQAAHQQNIIHRDLKPANVLLTADGTPKVADFGLAVLLDASTRHTQTEAVLGTPAYMAPEQARGDTANAGPLTDVYGLGAILYETLTGRPPFSAPGREKILEQVRTQAPTPPSRLRPGLSRELEAICLRCLEKDPARRYARALDLAEDLANWLAGKPTRTRPAGWLRRAARALRRPLRAAVVPAVVLAAAVCVAALTLFFLSPDPDRPLRKIEVGLAAGQRTDLIGKMGGPNCHNWVQGGDVGHTSILSDGTFSVSAGEAGLVELVHDPRVERFRLSAEILHRKSASLGASAVGLFSACCAYPGEKVPRHVFIRVSFNDHDSEAARWDQTFGTQPPDASFPPRPTGNCVFLNVALSTVQDGKSMGSSNFGGPSPQLFQPAIGVWRKLELEVTPEVIRAWWGENRQLIGEVWQRDVENQVIELQVIHARHPTFSHLLQGLDTRLTMRGSLGLFVSHASASFRNVVISPLPPPP